MDVKHQCYRLYAISRAFGMALRKSETHAKPENRDGLSFWGGANGTNRYRWKSLSAAATVKFNVAHV